MAIAFVLNLYEELESVLKPERVRVGREVEARKSLVPEL